jgi:hypothetical protein
MRIILFLFLLLITSASFGQVLQETNGSRADNRNVFKLGFRLPQVCWVTGNPNLFNYSAFQSKGAMVYDTCAGKIKRWSGSAWIAVADSMATGDTTGLGALFIRNTTTHENKRFSVQSGRLDSILAASSAGLSLYSNSGTQVGLFGAGGGAGATFYGGVNIDGTTRLNTGLTGVLIGTSGTVSATPNKMVSTFAKNATRDSAILTLADGTRLAVRDSVGGGGGGVTTMAAIGATPNANGATISGSTLNLQPASASFGGVVTTGTQTFAGTKTFGTITPTLITQPATLAVKQYYYDGGAGVRLGVGVNNSEFQQFSANATRFTWNLGGDLQATGTNELMRLNSTGLGINTTSGTAKLQVNATSGGANTGVRVVNTGAGTTDFAPYELVNNSSVLSTIFLTSSAYTPASGVRASGGGWRNTGAGGLSFVADNAAADITFHTNTAFAERLRIDQNGGVNIGGTADAAASSLLELTSTAKGFLPPRMTTADRDAIATPAAGLIIYNTSTNKHQGYNGTTWNDFY